MCAEVGGGACCFDSRPSPCMEKTTSLRTFVRPTERARARARVSVTALQCCETLWFPRGLVRFVPQTVLDQVKPAITESLDGMIADSDRLADDLLKELDLDHDGRVVKDEFITGFMTASERVRL